MEQYNVENLTKETIGYMIYDNLWDRWRTVSGRIDLCSFHYAIGMIDMYINLNWDGSNSSLVLTYINAIDTVEWYIINNGPKSNHPDSFMGLEDVVAEVRNRNVQTLGNLRRKLEALLEEYEQELI